MHGYDSLAAGLRGGKRVLAHRKKARAPKGTIVHHKDRKRGHNSRGNLVVTRRHPGRKGGAKVR